MVGSHTNLTECRVVLHIHGLLHLRIFGFPLAVNNYTARVSPDGKYAALGGFVSDVKVFSVQLGSKKQVQKVFALQGHSRGVFSVSFTGDSQKMLTLSKDGTCKLWDINGE
jgi:WD40 repeat protein